MYIFYIVRLYLSIAIFDVYVMNDDDNCKSINQLFIHSFTHSVGNIP